MKRMVVLLGGVLLVVGFTLGLMPVSASGVSCGSGFTASDDAAVEDYAHVLGGGSLRTATFASSCDDARSERRAFAVALMIPGGLLALGGVGAGLVAGVREEQPA